jgi:hypothetical protein
MAGEELFGEFSTHYSTRTIEADGDGNYGSYSGSPSWYGQGHRPYWYVNFRNHWWNTDSGDLYIYYYHYLNGWTTSASKSYGDGAAGGIYANTAHAWCTRWRMRVLTGDGDGTQHIDVLWYRLYDAAYLQRTWGLSAADKYVIKPDRANAWSDSWPTCLHTQIYAGDFLMARNTLSNWGI